MASHIIQALIKDGHEVTGTVRRAATGDDIFALHPEWKDHLDIVVVEDLANEESWNAVFEGKNFDHVSEHRHHFLKRTPCTKTLFRWST